MWSWQSSARCGFQRWICKRLNKNMNELDCYVIQSPCLTFKSWNLQSAIHFEHIYSIPNAVGFASIEFGGKKYVNDSSTLMMKEKNQLNRTEENHNNLPSEMTFGKYILVRNKIGKWMNVARFRLLFRADKKKLFDKKIDDFYGISYWTLYAECQFNKHSNEK